MKLRHLQFKPTGRASAARPCSDPNGPRPEVEALAVNLNGFSVTAPVSPAIGRTFRRPVVAWRRMAGLLRRCSSWVRAGSQRALHNRVNRLAQQQPALQAHAELVERTFLAIGGSLQEQSRLATQVAEQGRRLSSFTAATAESNPLRRAVMSIEQTLGALDRFHDETDRLIAGLHGQHDEIERLGSNGAQLERAIAPLRIVETLFRIESAGLEPEVQAAFSALTHDIAQLDGRVRDTFHHHFDAMRTTRQEIATVLEQLAAQRGEQEQVAAAQRTAIRRSLVTLEQEIARLRAGDERMIATVTALERDASGIVVALQFQDITRQKLEHVQSAIAALPGRVTAADRGGGIAFIEHATQLEAAQLDAVERDLAEAREAIMSGLRKISGHLVRIEQECASESAGGTVDQVMAIVRLLEDAFATVARLNARAAANAAATVKAVRSFRGITADLATTILELTWSIRLIALNAQVQAAQVQRCDGLEILARQTYFISEETSRHAERFGTDLVSLAHTLRQFVERAETFAAETGAVGEQLQSVAATTIPSLREQRGTVAEAMDRFGPLVRRTRDLAADLDRRAAQTAIDCTPLQAAAAELRQLGAWCAARTTSADLARVQPELSALNGRYTMASERAVHRAIVAPSHAEQPKPELDFGAAAATEQPAQVAKGEDDLGANIELF